MSTTDETGNPMIVIHSLVLLIGEFIANRVIDNGFGHDGYICEFDMISVLEEVVEHLSMESLVSHPYDYPRPGGIPQFGKIGGMYPSWLTDILRLHYDQTNTPYLEHGYIDSVTRQRYKRLTLALKHKVDLGFGNQYQPKYIDREHNSEYSWRERFETSFNSIGSESHKLIGEINMFSDMKCDLQYYLEFSSEGEFTNFAIERVKVLL